MVALNELLCWDQYYAVGGALRHVEFNPTPGTLNCADFPASVSTAPVQCMEISLYPAYNVLSKMLYPDPELRRDLMCIGGTSQWPATIFRGIDQWGERYGYLLVDPIGGAIGAFSHADGISTGGQARTPICKLPNVEHTEQSFPVLFLYRKEITDSGGAGKWRGGLSAESCFIPHGTDSITQDTLSSGNAIPTSTGMMGGYPGAVNRYRFFGDSDIAERMKRAELVGDIDELGKASPRRSSSASRTSPRTRPTSMPVLWSAAGGFGDPLERDPARVRADVENGDVSAEAAREIYGVVLDDEAETQKLREEKRLGRIGKPSGKKLDGKVALRATENLAVRANGKGGRWCCASARPISDRHRELQAGLHPKRPADQGLQPDRRRPGALHRSGASVPAVLLPGLRAPDRERDRGGRRPGSSRRDEGLELSAARTDMSRIREKHPALHLSFGCCWHLRLRQGGGPLARLAGAYI